MPHQAGEQAGLHEGGLLGVSRTTAPCAVVALLQLLSLSAVSTSVESRSIIRKPSLPWLSLL